MAETFAGKRFWVWAALLLLSFVASQMDAQPSALSTGIEGVVSIGPTHGGPTRAGEADSAPLANAVFAVANDAGAVTTFTTDASGHFRVALPPGRYSIKRTDVKMKLGHCGPFEVEVTADGFKKVQWDCDSGMR
jgi:carboxypeptidase family protein